MDLTKLSNELGITRIDDSQYRELKNLNLLTIPGIRSQLMDRSKIMGVLEDEIEDDIQTNATAIKLCLFSNSKNPLAKTHGKELRRMVVYELSLLDYNPFELSIILGVTRDTIMNDIQSLKEIPNKQWWQNIYKVNPASPNEVDLEFKSNSENQDNLDEWLGKKDDGL